MTAVALRELAFAALAERLVAELAGVAVERNRRAEVDCDAETLPRVILRDGAQSPDDGQGAGMTLYRVEALVEGYAAAATDAALGAAVNDLYRRVAAALFGRVLSFPAGFDASPVDGAFGVRPAEGIVDVWPVEGRLDVDFATTAQSDKPAAAFFLQLAFDLAAPTGAPFATY